MPDGWDDQLLRAVADHEAGRDPDTLGALQIVVDPARQGSGLSGQMLQGMRALGSERRMRALIACVRPTWKERYPLVPIERYARWTRDDGLPFDPWIRLHVKLGGRIVRGVPHAMTIPGTVADWESWTEMSFPESGDYVVPRAAALVSIDRERDQGIYHDPNVWMVHDLTAADRPAHPPERPEDTHGRQGRFHRGRVEDALEGRDGRGMLVSVAHKDFTDSFGEATALAKEMANQHTHSQSQLVRELGATRGTGFGITASPAKVQAETIAALVAAVTLLKPRHPMSSRPIARSCSTSPRRSPRPRAAWCRGDRDDREGQARARVGGDARHDPRREARSDAPRHRHRGCGRDRDRVPAGLWVGHTYGTLDPLVPPPKLNVFGRDYHLELRTGPEHSGGGPRDTGGGPVDILEPAIGAWPFVPPLGRLGDRVRHDGRLAARRAGRLSGVRAERRSLARTRSKRVPHSAVGPSAVVQSLARCSWPISPARIVSMP